MEQSKTKGYNSPMVYKVCLEIGYDGRWVFAHVPELPGCFTKEGFREVALERLPGVIGNYLSWMIEHGEEISLSKGVGVEVVEVFNCYTINGYEVNAFFEADHPPLSQKEIEIAIRRMEWSRQDLLSKTSKLPREFLDRKLDIRWTIRENLEHIATAEWWYLTRLNLLLPHHRDPSIHQETFQKMRILRELAIEKLTHLNGEERSRITVHSDEKWSARKVLRRFLEHEKEHFHSIHRLLP